MTGMQELDSLEAQKRKAQTEEACRRFSLTIAPPLVGSAGGSQLMVDSIRLRVESHLPVHSACC